MTERENEENYQNEESDENKRIKKKNESFPFYFFLSYFCLCLVYLFVYCYLVSRSVLKSNSNFCANNPKSLYLDGFHFDFYAYVTENESGPHSVHTNELIWKETNLTYGLTGSVHELNTSLLISDVSSENLIANYNLNLLKS